MKKLVILLMVVSMVGAVSAAPARTWWEGTESSDWTDAANWSDGVPGEGSRADWRDSSVEAVLDVETSIGRIVMGDGGTWGGQSLRITNTGSLILTDNEWSAVGFWRPAYLTVEAGGSLSTIHNLVLGRDVAADDDRIPEAGTAHLYVNGGIVDVGQTLVVGGRDGFGRATVDNGGVLSMNHLLLEGDMLVDVLDGTIVINENRTGLVQGWIDNGQLVGYGGIGEIIFDYDETNVGQTTITAIPEPATLALFGLGGLALLRKKK